MTDIIKYIQNILIYNRADPLLFNSVLFFGLFLLFYAIYIVVNNQDYRRLRVLYVVVFSLFFYYKCSGIYFLILIFSSLVDYYIGKALFYTYNKANRRLLLWISVSVNLGVLFYFKYTNFFIENINDLTSTNISVLDIFLPIGISFYTFQTMSYTIDMYRRKLDPAHSFWDFLFFVSFFPQLVAGPIVRAAKFIPQIRTSKQLSKYGLDKAILLIIGGLLKKVVISDYISVNFVDRIFDNPQLYSPLENLMGAYGYTVQIYCDFSGYSDMAIGLGLLLGFRLPQNFRSPYRALSITDFWRRWHMSLSFWLRDYLYISLGGNRKGKVRTYVNLFITMLLGGLWHGASWKFVIWGMLHGFWLGVERLFRKIRVRKNIALCFIQWFVTFHFVVFAWILFRASSYDKAFLLIDRISNLFNENYIILDIFYGYRYIILLMVIAFFTHLLPNRVLFSVYSYYRKWPFWHKAILLGVVIWLVYIVSSSEVQPFIYFQF